MDSTPLSHGDHQTVRRRTGNRNGPCPGQVSTTAASTRRTSERRQQMMIVRIRKAVLTGGSAAALAGVVSAVVTRALMGGVARLVNEPTHFSLGGSAGIALIYTVALLPGCL